MKQGYQPRGQRLTVAAVLSELGLYVMVAVLTIALLT